MPQRQVTFAQSDKSAHFSVDVRQRGQETYTPHGRCMRKGTAPNGVLAVESTGDPENRRGRQRPPSNWRGVSTPGRLALA